MKETWIILGASSAMARAFARGAAARGHHLLLAGRDADDLARTAADCRLRGAPSAEPVALDLREPSGFAPLAETAAGLDGAVNVACFAGSMPSQAEIDRDPRLLAGLIDDNFAGQARLLTMLAPMLEDRGTGAIVGVGSVAGDRGRLANYSYGAAKAGFHTFLSGLRNRLGRKGVHVMTVKPGFVDTAMTWGLPGMFLVAAPDDIADAIWRGLRRRRSVIYAPWFWIIIMGIIRAIPEAIFRKLKV
jgi:short-subunit dehydrogenase